MDEPLNDMIRRLREERCPGRVLREVKNSAAVAAPPAHRSTVLRLLIGTATVVALTWALVVTLGPNRSPRIARSVPERTDPTSRQTAHEAYASLASIGIALREAGNRSTAIILRETLPLVRQGINTTKNAINIQENP